MVFSAGLTVSGIHNSRNWTDIILYLMFSDTLDCLQKEYKEAEKITQDEQEGEETEEVDT